VEVGDGRIKCDKSKSIVVSKATNGEPSKLRKRIGLKKFEKSRWWHQMPILIKMCA